MEYTQEELMGELARRMTDEALEFCVNLGENTSFKEFEEKWKEEKSDKSFLK